jgi:hypothetical protein
MGPGKLQPNHLAGTGRGGSLVEDLFGRKEPVHVSPGLRLLKRGWSIGQSCAIDQFFTAAAAGQFPGVAFIETGLHDGLSEHTSNFDPAQPQFGEVPINVQTGAQFASKIINSVMQGPSWSDSVIFFAHDEGGGFFDHLPPMSVPNPDGIKPVDLVSADVPGDFTITRA